MAHKNETRNDFRAAYIGGLPVEAAADKCGIPHATARNWFRAAKKQGDDWDKHRQVAMMVAGGGIEQIMGRIIAAGLMRCEALTEQINNIDLSPSEAVELLASMADITAKLRKAGERMMPENDRLAIQSETVKSLADLFVKLHPKQAELIITVIEAYSNGQR